MLPEEKARVKIDKQLRNAGWDIISRNEYLPNSTTAVKEALMVGNTESDYLLFVDGKAIAVVEAKREENPLGDEVKKQAEDYAVSPQSWYALWFEKLIPLVYMANGNKIYFKNMLVEDSEYEELSQMHSPKKMLQIIGKKSEYGALPLLEKRGLRDCQYKAETKLEESLKLGNKKNLAVLATGSGKTYLACLASYRLLNYTQTKRILFLADRNNLAKQALSEFSLFDRTENMQQMGNLYTIKRLRKENDVNADIVISTIQKLFAVLTGQAIQDGNEDEEDELAKKNEEKESKEVVELCNDLKLPPDYFQLIIVDECHRSIYGKWKKVLDYFSGATVLGLTATPSETYIRNFSTALFKDSKRFQKEFRSTVETILFDYTDEVVKKDDILGFYNLYENPTYVMVKGNVVIQLDTSVIDVSEMPDGIALSNASLEKIRAVTVKANKVITVENLTTYHDSDEDDAVHIYLGGYHNYSKQLLLEKIYADNKSRDYFHKGDLDVYGFLILENLKEKTGIPFRPLMMDVATIERFYKAGLYKELTVSDVKVIEEKKNTKLAAYVDVLQFMLDKNCKVEQESIKALELME